jgi:tetratricopeptide (TPR) repeat protein
MPDDTHSSFDGLGGIDDLYGDAKRLSQQGANAEAAARYRQVAQLVENEEGDAVDAAPFWMLASNESLDANDFEAARADCATAIRIQPDSAPAHRWMGLILLSMRKWDEAEIALRKSIEILPTASALIYLGIVYRNKGDLREAEKALRHAIALDEDLEEAHSNLGNVLVQLGDEPNAICSYRTALRISPDVEGAYVGLADVLFRRGELANAKDVLEEGMASNPNDTKGQALLDKIVRRL